MRELTAKSNALADDVVAQWWEFAFSLFVKYRGYVVTHNESEHGEDPHAQDLPPWWLQSVDVGFTLWSRVGPFHGLPVPVNAGSAVERSSGPSVGVAVLGLLFLTSALGGAFQAGRLRASARCVVPADAGYLACA